MKQTCTDTIHGFKIDEHNESLLLQLDLYANRMAGLYDINKGLLFSGNVGSGKTALMKALQQFNLYKKQDFKFRFIPLWQLANEYASDGNDAFAKLRTGHWCFDELGLLDRETTSYFGNKMNIVELVIHERYNAFKDKGLLSHFTTNLSRKGIEEAYDERTVSRLFEMTTCVTVLAPDRRPTALVKPLDAPVVAPVDEAQIMMQIETELFVKYKREKNFHYCTHVTYDSLTSQGFMPVPTDKKKQEYMKKAKEEETRFITQQRGKNQIKESVFQRELQAIQAGSQSVKNYAKRLALKDHFDYLIDNNQQLFSKPITKPKSKK